MYRGTVAFPDRAKVPGRSYLTLSENVLRRLPRPIALLLFVLMVACAGQPPAAPPTVAAVVPTAAPTATIAPATPVRSAVPTRAPSPTLTPAPTQTPTLAPPTTPTTTPTPTATPATSPKASPTVINASFLPVLPPAGPDANTGGLSGQVGPRLKAALNQQRNSRGIPGMTAAVIFPDGSMWAAGSGYAKLPGRSAANNTPFVVGSITKTFVASAVMQLAEEGELTLDDPLSDFLPDYPRASEITLRQLLSHTAGVFNYFEHPSYNKKVFQTMKTHFWTPQEIVTQFARPLYFAPGTGYHYSNTGYVLLGLVIEEVTGQSLDDVLDDRFFTPLALNETHFQYQVPGPASSAHGYLRRPDGTFNQIFDTTNYRPQISAATVAWAAGGITASAREIARWADALYGGEGVVSDESLAQMTDYLASSYTRGQYGLGTRTRVHGGERMFGHTGSLRGFSASMWRYEDLDLTVVVLTNRGRIDPNPTSDVLAAIAISVLP